MADSLGDFRMPDKVVTKLLKDALPDNVLVSKDAKNAACRSACIFILQLTVAAAEKAQQNKRKNLDNQDIIKAVTDLGLGEYAPQLVRFCAQRKRNAKRKETSSHKRTNSKKFHPDVEQQDQEQSNYASDQEIDEGVQDSEPCDQDQNPSPDVEMSSQVAEDENSQDDDNKHDPNEDDHTG